jgi:DNA-binding NtrC family response regulator
MSRTILIIDDDPYIVKYLEDILQDDGYTTCTASNVEDAMQQLRDNKPDLITLDLEMPDEWGPRFYRKMVQDTECRDIPVIVVSGLTGIHLAIKNAVASFRKPFNPQELLETIKATLKD